MIDDFSRKVAMPRFLDSGLVIENATKGLLSHIVMIIADNNRPSSSIPNELRS